MNKILLIGTLTKTPERKTTDSGMAICRFSIAVNKYVKGEQKTTFINIVTFAKTAENCEKYLTKGSKVGIVGELEIRQYKDNQGNNKYMTEVIANEVEFLSSKQSNDFSNQNTNSEHSSQTEEYIDDFEEDLPF